MTESVAYHASRDVLWLGFLQDRGPFVYDPRAQSCYEDIALWFAVTSEYAPVIPAAVKSQVRAYASWLSENQDRFRRGHTPDSRLAELRELYCRWAAWEHADRQFSGMLRFHRTEYDKFPLREARAFDLGPPSPGEASAGSGLVGLLAALDEATKDDPEQIRIRDEHAHALEAAKIRDEEWKWIMAVADAAHFYFLEDQRSSEV